MMPVMVKAVETLGSSSSHRTRCIRSHKEKDKYNKYENFSYVTQRWATAFALYYTYFGNIDGTGHR